MPAEAIRYRPADLRHYWHRFRVDLPEATRLHGPVQLTGTVYAAGDTLLGARLYDEHEQYVGMISHTCTDDHNPFDDDAQRTVSGYTSHIDRIMREHHSFDAALTFCAQHAGLLLPGLQALENAVIRAPHSERALLRAAIDGLTARNDACRDRWATHAQQLSVRSRLYPEGKARTA